MLKQMKKPAHLKPMLCNRRSNGNEKPEHCNEEQPPRAATRESLHSHEDPEQPDNQVNEKLLKKLNLIFKIYVF